MYLAMAPAHTGIALKNEEGKSAEYRVQPFCSMIMEDHETCPWIKSAE